MRLCSGLGWLQGVGYVYRVLHWCQFRAYVRSGDKYNSMSSLKAVLSLIRITS